MDARAEDRMPRRELHSCCLVLVQSRALMWRAVTPLLEQGPGPRKESTSVVVQYCMCGLTSGWSHRKSMCGLCPVLRSQGRQGRATARARGDAVGRPQRVPKRQQHSLRPTVIPLSKDEEESARLGVASIDYLAHSPFFSTMILGSSHGCIGERENLHALPHLVRPRSLDAAGEKSLA